MDGIVIATMRGKGEMNISKLTMVVMLITVWTVAYPATASLTESSQRLGVVNGQVKDNQVVEVNRSLSNPVLYKAEAPEPLAQLLRVRNTTARDGDNGTIWLTVSQMLPGAKQNQNSTVTIKVTLWADGKKMPATYRQQGSDVLVSLPKDIIPKQQVMLRSDTPVTLQVPSFWRGPVEVVMDITGEE